MVGSMMELGDLKSGITISGQGVLALRPGSVALGLVPEMPGVSMIPEVPKVPPVLGMATASGVPEAPVLLRGRMGFILTVKLCEGWKNHFARSKHNKRENPLLSTQLIRIGIGKSRIGIRGLGLKFLGLWSEVL